MWKLALFALAFSPNGLYCAFHAVGAAITLTRWAAAAASSSRKGDYRRNKEGLGDFQRDLGFVVLEEETIVA